ncbi:gamma-glutamylcyclotransferase family protein [Acidovorax sp.]|uniref:gamma-glutamylcyclotransferase family protein n=1 Tax=Acidovorax sp. TaxID=1872122 RepID=UPI002637B798|nr:gamma-glutamylcyclotransferase family protein [Acidovorax sp.]
MPDEPMPPRLPRCVFVYGTLRRGGSNDITRLQPAPRFVGLAQVAGRLYHLGAYPGMVLGGSEWVQGEVYTIEPALEATLDAIEGIGGGSDDEYMRQEVVVPVAGQPMTCLVYEINPRCVAAAPVIAQGDWFMAVDRRVD